MSPQALEMDRTMLPNTSIAWLHRCSERKNETCTDLQYRMLIGYLGFSRLRYCQYTVSFFEKNHQSCGIKL